MKHKIELRLVRDFGENVNETIAFIIQNYKPLIRSIFIICGIFLLGDIFMESLTQIQVASKITRSSAYYTSLFLHIIFMMLAYLSVYLTSLCYITLYNEKKGEPIKIDEVWAYFKYYFLRFFGSGILVGIILFVIIVICMIPVGLFISGLSTSLQGANSNVLAVIYFFCLVIFLIPIIYLTPALSLMYPIMISENASFSYSLRRGFKLLKKNWWPTFGVFFITTGIVYVINIVIVLPVTILIKGQLLLSTSNIYIPVSILMSIFKGLLLITNLLPAIAMTVCYYNLVERKEDVGLIERIELFGKTDTDSNQLSTEEY